MPADDLPTALGAAFSVSAARRAGVSRSRLRRRDVRTTFHGARAVSGASLVPDAAADAGRAYPRSAEATRIHERAAQYAPVMKDGAFFSGVTAAVLWDAPIPARKFRSFDDQPPEIDPDVLEVAVHWPKRAPRTTGIRGRAVRIGLANATRHPVSKLLLASPASTWATLAPVLRHPYDLIAVADHFVHRTRPPHSVPNRRVPLPLSSIAQLAAAMNAGRREGVALLRAALPRVRTGAASRTETWTRLTLVDGGLPEPMLDHDVFDSVRRFLARVDMAYPQWKIAIEYEGAHHNTDERWEADIDRYAQLEAEGWIIIRVTHTMLFVTPDTLVERVRDAIARRTR
ncbi:endonuclease domain-containing protein [Microbacterium terrisoli]|uniref:endonuclease domain-containing protein n=1 Tax=Microbacterium terrisoli TaxID=3242192 RepID=UPI0028053AB2|nr:DUF559 domain-containing protein [Microbacterium protaetiae]